MKKAYYFLLMRDISKNKIFIGLIILNVLQVG